MPRSRSNRFLPILRGAFLAAAFLALRCTPAAAQGRALDIETIMQDPSWIGEAPSGVVWSDDSKWIYFRWNPQQEENASYYRIPADGGTPERVPYETLSGLPGSVSALGRGLFLNLSGTWDRAQRRKLFTRDGDIWLFDNRAGTQRRLTFTSDSENRPVWSADESAVLFQSGLDHFSLDLGTGELRQYVHFATGAAAGSAAGGGARGGGQGSKTELQRWLEAQQTELFDVLRERAADREATRAYREQFPSPDHPVEVRPESGWQFSGSAISPDGRYVVFRVRRPAQGGQSTIVPTYVTDTGFTEDIRSRSKVGEPLDRYRVGVVDTQQDTTYYADFALLDDLVADPLGPPNQDGGWKEGRGAVLPVTFSLGDFSSDGRRFLLDVRSLDNKDRFIMGLDPADGTVHMIDHQHDDAWIGGPIGGPGWMPDGRRLWYVSEKTGYAHLYLKAWDGSGERALTAGEFEVYGPTLDDRSGRWYFQANDVHPGVRHFYSMPAEGGGWTRYTVGDGAHDVTVSPDGRYLADLYSREDHPEELYVKRMRAAGEETKITESTTEAWRAYDWTAPPVITFPARDGAQVHARLYKPEGWQPGGPAVIFVHGAGYLQNAHKWWSSYSREYMFHHLLMQRGYMVLDMDYRGSAGYGRDWRTGIYRFMGGKDLTDQVDGAAWLVSQQGVDAGRIGIYGGSYGGFITLMAMFTTPDVFAAGAALRPVTDWAHYNHGYTSDILNTPEGDDEAYRRSSPIYHAEGLKGALLICHGLVDTNVHAQDSIRLAQRLIELRKEDWELALYPVENHGFTEPTSWMDEYKRILSLFETHLKP